MTTNTQYIAFECRPFTRPVGNPHDQNPAAHGCVCYVVERVEDGARRLENVNGLHTEVGPWVGSYKERIAACIEMKRIRQRILRTTCDQGTYILLAVAPGRHVKVRVESVDDAPLPSQEQYHSECADWLRQLVQLQQELTEAQARLDALEV